jgi:anti-anti-sigma factor
VPQLGQLTVEQLADGSVIALQGEHDLATAPVLAAELDALVAGGSNVVVDLSQTTFIDSSIVGVLHAASTHKAAGQAVVLAAPPGTVSRRLVDLIALNETMLTFDSRDAALAYLAAGRPST